MAASASTERPTVSGREIVLTRLLDAPRELVFDAFTRPEHLKEWWGPEGFTNTIHEMDVRPGGDFRLVMHGPDGRDYRNHMVFVEVLRPERIVFKHVPGPDTEPVSHETTILFVARGAKTELTMRLAFSTAGALQKMVHDYRADDGMVQTLGRLAGYVEGKTAL